MCIHADATNNVYPCRCYKRCVSMQIDAHLSYLHLFSPPTTKFSPEDSSSEEKGLTFCSENEVSSNTNLTRAVWITVVVCVWRGEGEIED
jgi:hypothetical protein